ncbi:MAG: M10 family metallopeptidase, partial [Pseudolabrys sp.]|nr:M10 family metallopeptidase [Pseudolabrys sp.]
MGRNSGVSVPAPDDLFPLADVSAGSSSQASAGQPVASIPTLAAYLLNGFWQYNGESAHHWATTTLTYNITGLTSAEQFLATSAMNAWHEVTNVTFVATTGSANITFNHNGTMQAFETDSFNSSGIMSSATVDISADWITTDGGARDGKTGIDSYGYQTYIHEIGHALGLGHQGPYNGSASYSTNAAYADDTWQYSVMSYFSQNNFDGGTYRYVITPQMADIYAVQQYYGAAATRTGDTVYGFHNTAGSIYNFSSYTSAPAFTIYDSGGNDTLDCSGYSVAQTIDLHAGSFSSVGGLVHNIGIALGTVIENAIGGSGNDTLIANDAGCSLNGGGGNDRLVSGAGRDVLTGGTGNDTFVFLTGGSSAATGQHDLITDFVAGSDLIDLTGWDAIAATPATDAFFFLGSSAFNGVAGALDYFFDSARGVTVLQGDTNGDRSADFAIDLTGNIALTTANILGTLSFTVLEANGATSLDVASNHYYLLDVNGSGPTLK